VNSDLLFVLSIETYFFFIHSPFWEKSGKSTQSLYDVDAQYLVGYSPNRTKPWG
jgi:hypothetical protein